MRYDYCVVGGGIVGMATAMRLLEARPGARLLLLEKERRTGQHQTSHNSGVIHAGVYYEPGSLKARLCRRGAAATKAFCREHDLPMREIGKLLVATTDDELARMKALEARSVANQLDARRLDADELREWEPHVAGVGALYVAATGITDYRLVCDAMAGVVRAAGGEIRPGVEVTGIRESVREVVVESATERWLAEQLVVCGGLQADRLARLAGLVPDFAIVPFRGEYYRLAESRAGLVQRCIYPIPDPALPFLGVHLTPVVDGGITLGPSAVLGLAREGYPKFSLNRRDAAELARFPGMWKVALRHWRTGLAELGRSLSKAAYMRACRKYCPSLSLEDLQPHEAGIRAQAVRRDGTLVHDFVLMRSARMLHVGNAPSPAATAAIPIGETIVERLVG